MIGEYFKQFSVIKVSIITISILFIIILIIVYIKKNKKDNIKEKLDIEDDKVDINNLINSINHSKNLYKQLIIKYHPDKYVNENEKAKAEYIVKEITKNKRDYKKLLEIENEALMLFKKTES